MKRPFKRTATDEPIIRARRRYHLGLPGGVYIFVTFLIALGAFNSQNNLLFWAFGFALSLMMISGLISGAMLMGLELVREPVSPLVEGESGLVHYRIRNRNKFVPAFALTVAEVAPRSVASRKKRRNGSSVTPPTDAISGMRAFVLHVAPRRTVAFTGRIRIARRGVATLDAMLVSTSFPFGIIKKSLLFDQTSEVIVRPRLLPLPHGFVNSAIRTGDRGHSPSRRLGAGDEFFSLREYQSGDSLRDIAWRASARRDSLYVKQTAAPAPMRMNIVLAFTGAPDAEHDEQAIRLAASAADAALSRNLAVGLRIMGAGPELRPRDGRMQREFIMDALARVNPDEARAAPTIDDHHDADTRSLRAPGVLVFVHAGQPDTSFSPPWAIHLSAADGARIPAHATERHTASS